MPGPGVGPFTLGRALESLLHEVLKMGFCSENFKVTMHLCFTVRKRASRHGHASGTRNRGGWVGWGPIRSHQAPQQRPEPLYPLYFQGRLSSHGIFFFLSSLVACKAGGGATNYISNSNRLAILCPALLCSALSIPVSLPCLRIIRPLSVLYRRGISSIWLGFRNTRLQHIPRSSATGEIPPPANSFNCIKAPLLTPPIQYTILFFLNQHSIIRLIPRNLPAAPPATMVQRNHVIAIIIIVLFVVLFVVAVVIYKVVHYVRRDLSVTTSESSSSGGSHSIAD